MKNVLKSLLLCSLVSGTAFADTYHYKDIIVGGRASTMGGAYNAMSDDASGSFYNPAGLAMTSGDSISGSAKIFNNTTTTYESTIGSNDWIRERNNLMANFFGIVKKYGKHTVALSYAVLMALLYYG